MTHDDIDEDTWTDDLICPNSTDQIHSERSDTPLRCALCGSDIPADRCGECGLGIILPAVGCTNCQHHH